MEVGSIRRIQGFGYGVLEFLGVGTMFDIFQNLHILYLEYVVLSFSGYGVLSLFPLWAFGLAVHVFNQGDDSIACLNKAMAFLITVASSRFPSTNNQLRTSSNLRNQATIQDGMVTVQQV
ncbi:hypothetical protein Tco_0955622 [Tanacetum coccineum]|uniref:Uncharacterized protein n=1 Tax=Tanacetum coccineum TaxID=301880 RepID=A0ABQ5E7S5_9ASTR